MNDITTQNPPVATSDGAGVPTYKAGCWVVIKQEGSTYDGMYAEYLERSDNGMSHLVRFDSGFTNWYSTHQIAPFDLWPANATPAELREIIRRFDRELTEMRQINASRLSELERARERLATALDHYRHDMGHWERTMRKEKDEQNWCDEGTNDVIRVLNEGFIGGWTIIEYSEIVEAEVTIRGEVVKTITVHVKDGDDPDDPENWVDEDGDEVDADHIAETALAEEYRRNGWDEWEVSC